MMLASDRPIDALLLPPNLHARLATAWRFWASRRFVSWRRPLVVGRVGHRVEAASARPMIVRGDPVEGQVGGWRPIL
jgi:hypothetical protein